MEREGIDLDVIVEPKHPGHRYFEVRDDLGLYYRSRDTPVNEAEIRIMRKILATAAEGIEATRASSRERSG